MPTWDLHDSAAPFLGVRRWLAAILLGMGILLALAGTWSILAHLSVRAGSVIIVGSALIAVGVAQLRPDRRALDASEVRIAPAPLVTRRSAPVPEEGSPGIVVNSRLWTREQPLGGPRSFQKAPPPIPWAESEDELHFELRAGVSDARVERAVRSACKAATRALAHRGRVEAHAQLDPDLGQPRQLKVRLDVRASILHEDDREACAAAFARVVRKKVG